MARLLKLHNLVRWKTVCPRQKRLSLDASSVAFLVVHLAYLLKLDLVLASEEVQVHVGLMKKEWVLETVARSV